MVPVAYFTSNHIYKILKSDYEQIDTGFKNYSIYFNSVRPRLHKKYCKCERPSMLHKRRFFLIGVFGGGVQLGPLGTAATKRPIVPAAGDYDDGTIGGMIIGRGNRSTRRKPAPMPLYPPQTPHAARTRTRAAAV
jgi:hypothetical protein